MELLKYLKNNNLFLDGAMGTMIQKLKPEYKDLPERLNIDDPELITHIHRSYYEAGCNVVSTNTFGASILKFDEEELDKIVKNAVLCADNARKSVSSDNDKWIALDIGPTGRMISPYGDLEFEKAVDAFSHTIRLGVKYGVDLIFIETFSDSYETKAALLAAKENCDLPVFVSNSYSQDKRLMTGADPLAMIAMLEGMGADAIGVNCSMGPDMLSEIAKDYLEHSSIPVIFKPNAGIPKSVDGNTIFDISCDEFASAVDDMIGLGVRIAGGCCGTTPDHLEKLIKRAVGRTPVPIRDNRKTCASSYSHTVFFDKHTVLIGERINPTGKKRFKEALINNDMDYILREGIGQQEKGADILDVNVGLNEIDEAKTLTDVVRELQAICDLPLQLDSSDPDALGRALRIYNGKAMINSVNGKESSMHSIFPLVKKYGGLVVALTLDENGIPDSADDRLKIARKILNTAKDYGINKNDIIFDPLTMAVSADKNAALKTLKSLKLIKEELGCAVSLGVSNVSFGLPKRGIVNSSFLTMAMTLGLNAAIINPYSDEIMRSYLSFNALSGLDENMVEYIAFADSSETISMPFADTIPAKTSAVAKPLMTSSYGNKTNNSQSYSLKDAVIRGLKKKACELAGELVLYEPPMDIIQNEIISALDIVGDGFEKKSIYLPQLLMSAEAAGAAFEQIKKYISVTDTQGGIPFVIATVQGDIHDIGKNIVRLLLENYGFSVSDLGKNVDPQKIADEVKRLRAPLAGLSALMTTTVPKMEETIRILHQEAPWCKIVVGGAVLTEEYAKSIHADKYAADAMETVRYAQYIKNSIKEEKL